MDREIEELLIEQDLIFDADSVFVYSKTLKEEVYFKSMRVVVVELVNATTGAVDFKTLPTLYYQGFDDFVHIEDQLREEALPLAEMVMERHELEDYDELIVEFIKYDYLGEKKMYRFICHYSI